jgi:hypothetical protein
MEIHWNRSLSINLISIAVLAVLSAVVVGQNQTPPAASQPAPDRPRRARAAELPSVPWKPVYLSDGEPDWSGFWRANPGGDTYDITGGKARPDSALQGDGTPRAGVHRVGGTPDGRIPYQPWAEAHYEDVYKNVDSPTKPEYVDTQAHCLLEGPGRVFIHSGFEIIQAPGYVVFLTEENDEQVIVPIDRGSHVGSDIHLWQGDRRGHWEGNTLVVDVANVKGKSRLDMSGNFYGPSTHFVERYTRVDDNTIQYQATVTDPTIYTQPWTLSIRFQRAHGDDPHYELWEDACHEGERSADRLVISPEAQKVMEEAAAKASKANPGAAGPATGNNP